LEIKLLFKNTVFPHTKNSRHLLEVQNTEEKLT